MDPQVLAHDPEALAADPENFCARARLAATADHGRTEHFLWLIRNHPDWEGFAIWPMYGLRGSSNPKQELLDVDKLKRAWEDELGAKASAPVLHNAALFFFRQNEPFRAVELLDRARGIEPGRPTWSFLQGMMFGNYLEAIYRSGDIDWQFVAHAAEVLRSTDDAEVLQGAAVVGMAGAKMTGRTSEVLINRAKTLQQQNYSQGLYPPFYVQNCMVLVKN
jgi:hypothetical protein